MSIDLVDVISIIAVIISPIVALAIGQVLQDDSDKRRERYEIFQILYRNRFFYWSTLESVNALNSIDIIFYKCKEVVDSWKKYNDYTYSGEKDIQTIINLQNDLLSKMAESLGYHIRSIDEKDVPYHPVSLDQELTVKNAYDTVIVNISNAFSNQNNDDVNPSESNGIDFSKNVNDDT